MAFISTQSTRALQAHRLPLLSRLTRLAAIHRSRRALAQLDASALEDIGLTAREAHIEASKPIWDAPSNWRA